MSTLVICEKPSVATDVAKALASSTERFDRRPWGFESASWKVAAAAGHLVAERSPDAYDPSYAKWSFEQLPIIPDEFLYEPRDERAAERLGQLCDLICDDDVTEIVNAADAGREGELIFKLILGYAGGTTKPVRRAWFASMTADALREAFANLRDDAEMAGLEAAARCRSEADWLVGMNATRAATCTLGGGRTMLSVGRVQTPTLALVVNRDVAIDTFVATDFWRVRATFDAPEGSYTGWWVETADPTKGARFDDKAAAEAIVARVAAATAAIVASVEVRTEKVSPPKLFDLTELQREANRRYGLSAATTLEAAQACYEKHKVLSYPRTDSRYLTTDMAPLVARLVGRVRDVDPAYAPHAETILAGDVDTARLINDAKVNDHHAIVPTDAKLDLSPLSPNERKIFDLVARRLLESLLGPQLIERTVIVTDAMTAAPGGTDTFRSAGAREVDPGWKVASPSAESKSDDDAPADDDADTVVAVSEGDQVTPSGAELVTGTTKAPPRFNEASLLGAMATAGKLVDDDEAAEAMRESGLGTPATRASILERLIKVGYLERQGRQLRATGKGRGLVLALGEHPLVRPDLTGGWEQRLHHIERAGVTDADSMRDTFVTDVRTFTAEVVTGFAGRTPDELRAGLRKLGACPVPGCEGEIVETPKAWACSSWKSKEEPGCGATFWKQQNGKKTTEKQAAKWMADVAAGKVTVAPPVPRVVIGPCPSDGCDGEIVSRAKSWGCTSWKSPSATGCGYVVWRTNDDGSEVTEDEARCMVAAGESNARVVEVLAPCPMDGCKGRIVARAKSFGCDSWKPPKRKGGKPGGCGYVIWRTNGDGSEVTVDEALALIAEGKTNGRTANVVASCPKCSGNIVERAKSWSCDSWKSKSSPGCGTTIWKMQAGREIDTETALTQLAALGTKS